MPFGAETAVAPDRVSGEMTAARFALTATRRDAQGSFMNLQRIRSMEITELAYRGRQEVSKWLERARMNGKRNGESEAALAKILSGHSTRDLRARALRT